MKKIAIFFLILIASVFCVYFMQRTPKKSLPIINPVDVNEEMVDPSLIRKGIGHTIGSFSFKNQHGENITDKDVRGKVFVAEYFFTTCGTICPKMNQQMQRIQKAYSDRSDLKILSFTVNPEIDTVEQMKRYATSHEAKTGQWHFLTGDKTKLYSLARKSFFVLKPSEVQNLGDAGSDFIHTNNFVLVDRKMRIRGYYDGTSEKEVGQLIKDIEVLFNE